MACRLVGLGALSTLPYPWSHPASPSPVASPHSLGTVGVSQPPSTVSLQEGPMQQGGPRGPHLPLGPKARNFRWPWRPEREDAASEDRAHRARGERRRLGRGSPALRPRPPLTWPSDPVPGLRGCLPCGPCSPVSRTGWEWKRSGAGRMNSNSSSAITSRVTLGKLLLLPGCQFSHL